jgi:hypothetical protein
MVVKSWSPNEYWCVAEYTPIGIAMSQVMVRVAIASTAVNISRWPSRSATGRS